MEVSLADLVAGNKISEWQFGSGTLSDSILSSMRTCVQFGDFRVKKA